MTGERTPPSAFEKAVRQDRTNKREPSRLLQNRLYTQNAGSGDSERKGLLTTVVVNPSLRFGGYRSNVVRLPYSRFHCH
jgi:hypothetical protein